MRNLKIIVRKTCRVCGNDKLERLFSLGKLYVSDFVKLGQRGIKAPLDMVYCNHCTLLQLKHTAPQEIMYSRHYWYKSSINPVIVEDLKEIASQTLKMVPVSDGDTIFDIGANDGTLLRFYPQNLTRVGCEPATNLAPELQEVTNNAIIDFWDKKLWKKKWGKAKIITAIGMFYDMEYPNQFIRDARKVLHRDGIFVTQLMCLSNMLEKNDVGNICHEHLEFYSLPSLKYLFEKNGLEIFKVQKNTINGGSYRIFARHFKRGSIKLPETYTKKDYKDFFKRIKENRDKTVEFVKRKVREGKKVYGFGASTKFNTILQWYGLNRKWIKGIADRNPEKHGKFTIGTNIPILKEKIARKDADYFLVGPYAFIELFRKKNKRWLKEGGHFIMHTPNFHIINYED